MMKCKTLAFAAVVALAAGAASDVYPASGLRLDEMGIVTTHSREFSFSDKAAGFFYGMTGTDNWTDGNAGWNVFAKKVFTDYALFVDGEQLLRKEARTEVNPYRMCRLYKNARESFFLVDNQKVIFIELDNVKGKNVSLQLQGDNLKNGRVEDNTVVFDSEMHPGNVLRVAASKEGEVLSLQNGMISSDADCGGFILAFGSPEDSKKLVADSRANEDDWLAARKRRMQALVDDNAVETNQKDVAHGLAWIELTADELVTQQHGGWGIYAGFPWFTDFWGRDMFISMPGMILCTGQFDVARDILLSFGKYQDMDPKSETYGRVPNRLNLDGILYNTTDGTPRFVIQAYDYLRYSGDVDFIKQIYKNVKIATDASIDLYTDEKGYLTHADADTWMDAKRQSKYPCSPRGNRAVDIQALWYNQLDAAAKMADYMGKKSDAKRWREVAAKLRANFEHDFVDKATGKIYDHLNADGTPDMQLRPNTIYAHELISDMDVRMADTRTMWEHLVYPWGVSSLDQMDDQFHAWHEQWHRYHKDDAYHNGTVWLWQNGEAMARMIEFGQADVAYQLFRNMNRQALDEGAVGSLSECADAWCRPGQTWARRSGTFLQAWSNAEHIRAWSQYFLGVRPDMLAREITINPMLPKKAIKDLETSVLIGEGRLDYTYRKLNKKDAFYQFGWDGKKPVDCTLDIDCFIDQKITLNPGEEVEISVNGKLMDLTVVDATGKVVKTVRSIEQDDAKVAFKEKCDAYFKGVQFAEPTYREDLKSMSRYFNPPLDYYSVE